MPRPDRYRPPARRAGTQLLVRPLRRAGPSSVRLDYSVALGRRRDFEAALQPTGRVPYGPAERRNTLSRASGHSARPDARKDPLPGGHRTGPRRQQLLRPFRATLLRLSILSPGRAERALESSERPLSLGYRMPCGGAVDRPLGRGSALD